MRWYGRNQIRQFVFTVVLAGLACTGSLYSSFAQVPESPWTTVATLDSVEVSYIMYRKADNENNGVVVKLVNRRPSAVGYRFTIIFRSTDGGEEAHKASGILGSLEMKTGESSGLFWIPFKDGSQLAEVGIRGFRAERFPG